MSLKSYLKSVALAAAVTAGSMASAKTAEQPDAEPEAVGIFHHDHDLPEGQRFWTDESINGIKLASMKELPSIGEKSWNDVLDPEGKYHSETSDGWTFVPGHLYDGRSSTETASEFSSEFTSKSGEAIKDSILTKCMTGEVDAIQGVPGAVVGFTLMRAGETRTNEGSKIIDSLTRCNFHLKTQTDRRTLQQWYQDSMNAVLSAEAPIQQKNEILTTLANGMGATMSDVLDRSLPNPENVQALSGDMTLPGKILEEAKKTGKPVHFDGLNPTQATKTLSTSEIQKLASGGRG